MRCMSKKMVDRSVVKTQHSATLTPRRFSDPPGGYKNKDRFDTKTRLLNGLTLAFFFFGMAEFKSTSTLFLRINECRINLRDYMQ